MTIEFFIPHEVRAKQGDRVFVRNGRAMHYTPAATKHNAAALAVFAAQHKPSKPMRGPIAVDLTFQFPWRASEPKKNRTRAWPKDTKPDADNCSKQLLDVLQSVGFYVNDAQVYDLRARKLWTDDPGVQVRIEEWDNGKAGVG